MGADSRLPRAVGLYRERLSIIEVTERRDLLPSVNDDKLGFCTLRTRLVDDFLTVLFLQIFYFTAVNIFITPCICGCF